MKFFTMLVVVVLFCAVDLNAGPPSAENTIYDSDTNHLWNRLNETLFERTAQDGKKYGLDELDILYWVRTTNLLAGTSHQQAISILDEFINTHAEKLIRDPFKRVLLQRDLWQLFDWTVQYRWNNLYEREELELQKRVAVIIRRLALTTNEIAALPDNYSLQTQTDKLPDLPQGLFQTNGDWVNLAPDPNGNEEIAPLHDHSFYGHSAFLVMLRLPEGRQAAFSYLDQLRSFEHFWVYQTNTDSFAVTNSPREILTYNTNLPQFPTNTKWAIVRQMFVIDADGNIQPTRMVESIQLRRYLAIMPSTFAMVTNHNGDVSAQLQNFYEFQMSRRQNSALREIAKDEKVFSVHLFTLGIDPFEWKSSEPQVPDSSTFKGAVLESCRTCHSGPGIYSVNVYAGLFARIFHHSIESPQLFNLDTKRETDAAIDWKREQYSWGLLQGLWNRED